ncbi:MAG TPA: efflux RND transporter periplasmic adaptor subunit [Xanthobacteraceae bacterium]|nr:efflux RND transporter periplasmic adaptor subunit [Xanthobacteraceae bacterium]
MRLAVCATIFMCGLGVAASAQQPQPTTVPVGTVVAERKPITKTLDFVGRVEAINRVEVRARVTGYLEAVLFKEGDLVQEGAPLYRIERDQFQAAVEQAQGALERSRASKTLSELQLHRAQELLDKQAGSVVTRDQARAADQQAAGTVMQDEAALQTAKINLGYTDITAPIAGKIGRTNITKGNVVSPDSGVLTTIVSQDPMYITFPVSQRELLRAREARHDVHPKDLKVRIRFSDGTVYDQVGLINFLDVSVDRATDTVTARATMPNPNGALIDGQLVRVEVEIGAPEDRVVIPQAALLADQQGVYVFVVEDGKAAVKRIKPGAESGTGIVVDQGLSGGEQVIVDGLQGMRPGLPVRASPIPPAVSRS